MMAVIAKMKKKIPEHPVLGEQFERLVSDGLSEDAAFVVVICAWLMESF